MCYQQSGMFLRDLYFHAGHLYIYIYQKEEWGKSWSLRNSSKKFFDWGHIIFYTDKLPFFSWGKSRTIHFLCPLCYSSRVFVVVYSDRLYQKLFLDQQKNWAQYFPLCSRVCIFSVIDKECVLQRPRTLFCIYSFQPQKHIKMR